MLEQLEELRFEKRKAELEREKEALLVSKLKRVQSTQSHFDLRLRCSFLLSLWRPLCFLFPYDMYLPAWTNRTWRWRRTSSERFFSARFCFSTTLSLETKQSLPVDGIVSSTNSTSVKCLSGNREEALWTGSSKEAQSLWFSRLIQVCHRFAFFQIFPPLCSPQNVFPFRFCVSRQLFLLLHQQTASFIPCISSQPFTSIPSSARWDFPPNIKSSRVTKYVGYFSQLPW